MADVKYPKLTPEEDKTQRGDDPRNVRHDEPQPRKPITDAEYQRRKKLVQAHFSAWKEKHHTRQDGIWPYLLVRAFAGDHGGGRPMWQPQPFWESPDILVVPGDVPTYNGGATLAPQAGKPHTIFVHVWNLGRLMALGVKLSVYWANPTFSFDDPNHPPHLIGATMFELADRLRQGSHMLVRLPQLWTPVMENNGHECLLAKVGCFTDGPGHGFDANHNRHIGQRNLNLVSSQQSIKPLLDKLAAALPAKAELQLIHGMHDLKPIVLAHAPALAPVIAHPVAVPVRAVPLPGGTAHLGAVVPGPAGLHAIPAAVAAPAFTAGAVTAATLAAHPAATVVAPQLSAPEALMHHLGITDLRAGNIATHLGGDAHVLRFVATQDGKAVGGYTIIVRD